MKSYQIPSLILMTLLLLVLIGGSISSVLGTEPSDPALDASQELVEQPGDADLASTLEVDLVEPEGSCTEPLEDVDSDEGSDLFIEPVGC